MKSSDNRVGALRVSSNHLASTACDFARSTLGTDSLTQCSGTSLASGPWDRPLGGASDTIRLTCSRAREVCWSAPPPESLGEAIVDASCRAGRARDTCQREREREREERERAASEVKERAEERRQLELEKKAKAREAEEEFSRIRRDGNSDPGFAFVEALTLRRVFCPRIPDVTPRIYPDSIRVFFRDSTDAIKYGYRHNPSQTCRRATAAKQPQTK